MPTRGPAKRQIATESTEKPAKRTRISRACDQCRVAREKCDGLQPACTTCSVSKRTCSYTVNPKKRGIQPGYIRSLELALAWLFQLNPDNESQLNERLAQGGHSSLFLSRDSKESNKLHKRWRKARFYTDVDKLLSGGEPSRHEPSEPASPQSDGEDSVVEDPSTLVNHQNLRASDDLYNKVATSRLSQLPPEVSSHPPVETFGLSAMPIDSWNLFDIYFTYTQSWLPISEKHDVLKLSYAYPEQGLLLSPALTESGSHAELWSILAVASLYEDNTASSNVPSKQPCARPVQFYNTARSLVPTEIKSFDLSHVKALLNLALFDIVRSIPESAWLLVGCASRVLEVMDESFLVTSSRQRHVFAGCFLLDSMLAISLRFRQPHFSMNDISHLGLIDEDGLEEWQPWTGHTSSTQQMRTPMLALSIFNCLLNLVEIFKLIQARTQLNVHTADALASLETWKTSVPTKLAFVLSELSPAVSTPPAVLLQLTYYCAMFAASPSAANLHRILNSLDRSCKSLGFKNMPPVYQCLLRMVDRYSTQLVLEDSTRARLHKLYVDIARIRPHTGAEERKKIHDYTVSPWAFPVTALQMPTPDALSTGLSITQPDGQPLRNSVPDVSSPTGAFLAESHLSLGKFPVAPSPSQPDPRYPGLTSDLESFFDDLASLDSTTRLDTQPQFMQNLGFAPDANMADLFSEYIPMQSSAFLSRDDNVPTEFDQYSFYNVG